MPDDEEDGAGGWDDLIRTDQAGVEDSVRTAANGSGLLPATPCRKTGDASLDAVKRNMLAPSSTSEAKEKTAKPGDQVPFDLMTTRVVDFGGDRTEPADFAANLRPIDWADLVNGIQLRDGLVHSEKAERAEGDMHCRGDVGIFIECPYI